MAASGEIHEPTRPEALKRQAFMGLVQAAIQKTAAKQPIDERERRAWERWEADEDERRGLRFLSQVPKKTYCLFSGRPTKILHDQADLYGLPLRGATINVAAVISWLHEFLAKWKHDLAPLVKGVAAGDHELGLKQQLQTEQVQLYRRRVQLLEHELARQQGDSLDRAETHALLGQMALVLRTAGEQLEKQFGATAASILEVALDNCESMIAQLAEPKPGESPPHCGDAAATPDDRGTVVDAAGGAGPADSPDQPVRRRGRGHSGGKKSGK